MKHKPPNSAGRGLGGCGGLLKPPPLGVAVLAAYITDMMNRDALRAFFRTPPVRLALFIVGLVLMAAAPFVGILPGPGGIFVFAAGLALALRNSDWAKRRYVRFKRWQPRVGHWADWGMRRGSHLRREARRKAQGEAAKR